MLVHDDQSGRDDEPITAIGLSKRSLRALEMAGLTTRAAVLGASDRDLLARPFFTRKMLNEVREKTAR